MKKIIYGFFICCCLVCVFVIVGRQKQTQNLTQEEMQNQTTLNSTQSNISNTTEHTENSNEIEIKQNRIIKTLRPGGFAGASLHRINLYSNGDVYIEKHNGKTNDEKDIISNQLIAEGVTELIQDDESDEKIVLKGNNVKIVNNNYNWITVEQY